MEDNAPVHKKVCIPFRQELGMRCHQHPPNSADLNPIENIWVHIKHRIAKEYASYYLCKDDEAGGYQDLG
jgi:transposase